MTRRYLEKPSLVLGVPMGQVAVLAVTGVLLVLASKYVQQFIPYFKTGVLLTVLAGIGLLRWTASKNDPSFLSSRLSFHLLQKKKTFEPTADCVVNAQRRLT